jgi:hypothetical protein
VPLFDCQIGEESAVLLVADIDGTVVDVKRKTAESFEVSESSAVGTFFHRFAILFDLLPLRY